MSEADNSEAKLAEEMLMGLPLDVLRDLEQGAERDFRRSSNLGEMMQREHEWRTIEAVYLKRLSKGEKSK